MKKVLVVLCFIVLIIGCLVCNEIIKNNQIKNKISDRSSLIYQNTKDKEIYESKKRNLEELKENNKEKTSKYYEVEAWNQEIIKYLD